MTPLLDQQRAANNTMEAYTDFRHWYSTEQYKDCVKWIEALIVQHQAAMTQCGAAKLPDAQVRLKQLISMRSALVEPGGATTGYTFD